jgi:hypothetical protein
MEDVICTEHGTIFLDFCYYVGLVTLCSLVLFDFFANYFLIVALRSPTSFHYFQLSHSLIMFLELLLEAEITNILRNKDCYLCKNSKYQAITDRINSK